MKKLFILFLSITHIYGKEVTERDPSEKLEDPFVLAEKLNELRKKPTAEEREVNKLKSQLVIMKLKMEQMESIQQTAVLKQDLINQKREHLLRQKIKDREYRLAYAWSNSKTGIEDGRCWYDLDYAEQEKYRLRFYSFYKK